MSEITAEQLKDGLGSATPPLVLDIRPPAEYEAWHIEGAINLPVYDSLKAGNVEEAVHAFEGLPTDRPLVAVCRAVFISQKAAHLLERMHKKVTSLQGGMRGWGAVWTEARIPLTSAPTATLLQVRRNGKGCLSYVLIDGDQAAVVDPSVSTDAYLELVARHGARVTMVLETHVHADHLSRARDLALHTMAELIYPQNDRLTFLYRAVRDGDRLRVGAVELEVMATPGHTGESVCYRIGDDVLLTGDTLFTSAVGRPDLEKGSAGAEAGAHMLWASLHGKLQGLPGGLRVLPAHHAAAIGFDGTPVAATLADLRTGLDLLQVPEDAFVARILGLLQAKPPNFEMVVAVNEGKAGLEGIDPLDVEAGPNRCAVG